MHGNVQSSLLDSFAAILTRVGILEGEGHVKLHELYGGLNLGEMLLLCYQLGHAQSPPSLVNSSSNDLAMHPASFAILPPMCASNGH